MHKINNVKRTDIVFDIYKDHSFKSTARERREFGRRVIVSSKTPIPKNWQSFLRVNENKAELFELISDYVTCIDCDKIIVATKNEKAVTNDISTDLRDVSPCKHEEADTRILLHTLHQTRSKSRKVYISTVDTDVIVIALSKFYGLSTVDLKELWAEVGVGVNRKWIAVHRLAHSLSPSKCGAFPSWYALTGSDTVSSCHGNRKKSAWKTWKCYPEATEVFLALSNPVDGVLSDNTTSAIERFICLMYDKTTYISNVNDCRRMLFTKKSKTVDNIPPSRNALIQHVKRTVYQAG